MAISAVTAWPSAPSQGRLIPPPSAPSTTTRVMLEGMAKPMPMLPPDWEKIELLMPISSPRKFTSAPPEFPGLIAASVWMKN